MAEQNKVVAHFLDGTLVKGTTQDFFPNRPNFHIQPITGGPAQEIKCLELKAVFFVRDYVGSAVRQDPRGFITGPKETAHGKKLAVRFKDRELLCGYSLSFSKDREGFFMFPADAAGNNQRIYVLHRATEEIKAGDAAEAMVQKALDREKAA